MSKTLQMVMDLTVLAIVCTMLGLLAAGWLPNAAQAQNGPPAAQDVHE